MDSVLVVLTIMFALGILGLVLRRRDAAKAKKFGAKEYSTMVVHMHGMPGLQQNSLVNLFLTDEKIIIEANKNFFELNYSKINAAEALRKTDILTKDKSVIGRAIVGTILPLGLAGTLVGAISGVGKKKVKGDFLVINYTPSPDSEAKVLIFDIKNFSKAMKLSKFIKSKLPTGQTIAL